MEEFAVELVLYTFHFNWLDALWWLIPLTLSGIWIAASVGVRKSRQTSPAGRIARVLVPVMTFFCVCFSLAWIGLSLFSYHAIKTQIAAGVYEEVFGVVEHFSPMPWSGKKQETFVLDGDSFSYSTFGVQPGYHTAASWGGVINRNGQHLRIRYVGAGENKIIIWIAEIPS